MKKFCLALDLKDDEASITQYEKYHTNVWSEIKSSIRNAGITAMDIYRVSNRLFMIIEATDDFSFEKKSLSDAADAKVQEWEKLMSEFQQPLPGAIEGEKWMLMRKIFELNGNDPEH